LISRRIRDVELGAMQADVGANLPGQQRMLLGGIVADQQDRGRVKTSRIERCVFCGRPAPRRRRVIGGAVVVDVVGAEHGARELLQQVVSSLVVRFEPMTPIDGARRSSRSS
jgi:hypothetical protein